MTAPLPHGYPDFGRYAARSDKLIHSQSNVVISAETEYGPYFVGDVPHIGLRFFAQTNHFQLQATFFDTVGASFFLGNRSFSLRQNSTLDITIPVMGAFVVFTVSPSGANSQFTLRSWNAYASMWSDLSLYNSPVLASMDQSIGAGAAVEVDATRIWPGSAHWFVAGDATTWITELRTIDYLGTVQNIALIRRFAADSDGFIVFLPAINARIRTTNLSGSAATFRAYLVGRPIEPGR